MDWLHETFQELWAITNLVMPALEALKNSKPSDFWFWFWGSVSFAVVMYFATWGAGRLVFKSYRLTSWQHLVWAFNSALSGLAIMFWVVGQNLAPGLNLLLLFWQGSIKLDQDWGNNTYGACYQAVKSLGLEDFSRSPEPGKGGKTFIPLNHADSRLTYTRVMMDRAAIHFATAFPALGRLLEVTDGLSTPSSELKTAVDEFFEQATPDEDGSKTLPRSKAIDMCSDILRETFQSRVGSLETLAIVLSISVPVFAWLLLFAWVLRSSNTILWSLVQTMHPK